MEFWRVQAQAIILRAREAVQEPGNRPLGNAGAVPDLESLRPKPLAPGAAGAGGRFGNLHVIVVGEAQAGQWLANTLNNAVNRGVTLMATSSQRGSPVGH